MTQSVVLFADISELPCELSAVTITLALEAECTWVIR